MTYKFDRSLPLPIYIQIANQMADEIKSGRITQGAKLPSVRNLAKETGVSHLTADRVYKYLEKEKLAERIHGRGTFAAYKSHFTEDHGYSADDVKKAYESLRNVDNHRSLLVNLFNNTSYRCAYNFSYALLNPEILNRHLPTVHDLSKDKDAFHLPRVYGEIKGFRPLRDVLLRETGSEYTIDEVIITNGVQHGINLAAMAMINPGDTVLIESPTFAGAVDILHNAQANLIPMKLFQDGFSAKCIEDLCKKHSPKLMYLTPDFSNPSGYYLTNEERIEILSLADRYNFYIIEDDHWSWVHYDEKITPLALLKRGHKRVIYLKGFSKIIGPDNRIGAMFAPTHIIERVQEELTLQSLGVATLPQQYLYALIKNGYYKKVQTEMLRDLKKRSQTVNRHLRHLKKYGVSYEMPAGGINYWIQLPEHLDSTELLFRKMYENDITYLPGSLSSVALESNYTNYFRLNFSFASYDNLQLGLEKLVKLLTEALK